MDSDDDIFADLSQQNLSEHRTEQNSVVTEKLAPSKSDTCTSTNRSSQSSSNVCKTTQKLPRNDEVSFVLSVNDTVFIVNVSTDLPFDAIGRLIFRKLGSDNEDGDVVLCFPADAVWNLPPKLSIIISTSNETNIQSTHDLLIIPEPSFRRLWEQKCVYRENRTEKSFMLLLAPSVGNISVYLMSFKEPVGRLEAVSSISVGSLHSPAVAVLSFSNRETTMSRTCIFLFSVKRFILSLNIGHPPDFCCVKYSHLSIDGNSSLSLNSAVPVPANEVFLNGCVFFLLSDSRVCFSIVSSQLSLSRIFVTSINNCTSMQFQNFEFSACLDDGSTKRFTPADLTKLLDLTVSPPSNSFENLFHRLHELTSTFKYLCVEHSKIDVLLREMSSLYILRSLPYSDRLNFKISCCTSRDSHFHNILVIKLTNSTKTKFCNSDCGSVIWFGMLSCTYAQAGPNSRPREVNLTFRLQALNPNSEQIVYLYEYGKLLSAILANPLTPLLFKFRVSLCLNDCFQFLESRLSVKLGHQFIGIRNLLHPSQPQLSFSMNEEHMALRNATLDSILFSHRHVTSVYETVLNLPSLSDDLLCWLRVQSPEIDSPFILYNNDCSLSVLVTQNSTRISVRLKSNCLPTLFGLIVELLRSRVNTPEVLYSKEDCLEDRESLKILSSCLKHVISMRDARPQYYCDLLLQLLSLQISSLALSNACDDAEAFLDQDCI